MMLRHGTPPNDRHPYNIGLADIYICMHVSNMGDTSRGHWALQFTPTLVESLTHACSSSACMYVCIYVYAPSPSCLLAKFVI